MVRLSLIMKRLRVHCLTALGIADRVVIRSLRKCAVILARRACETGLMNRESRHDPLSKGNNR